MTSLQRLLDHEKLEQVAYRIDPQSKLLRIWGLKGGVSSHMTAFETLLPDGQNQKLIVRRPSARTFQDNPHACANEYRLLQLMQAKGVATQRPFYLDESGEIFPTPYLVIEYLEAKPDFSPTNLGDCTLQLATHLARIHSIDGSTEALSFLPDHPPAMRPATVEQSSDEGRIREALGLIGSIRQLNKKVLLHGDYWPGNILWNDGKLVAVIDWEEARLGDPLIDLAIARLDILWLFGVEAMHDFTRRYQSMTTNDFTNLPYWDLRAALRSVASLGEWATSYPPLGRPDITEQSMREGHRLFTAQAFEKLSAQ